MTTWNAFGLVTSGHFDHRATKFLRKLGLRDGVCFQGQNSALLSGRRQTCLPGQPWPTNICFSSGSSIATASSKYCSSSNL